MEEGGEGGGDQTENSHCNEAISAVASDYGFLEDGYDDLCNEVNAGEGSVQSGRKNEDDLGFSNHNEGSPPTLGGGNVNNGGGTILCVGDLHWWTTDAELETELGKYGPVKEVEFLEDEETGKSKGSCHVEFYDPAAAMACKENMNGHVFNGRPCVVSYASPNSSVKKTVGSNAVAGGNYQGGDANIGGYERGNWGRGNARGMGNRGPAGPMRNRGRGGLGQGIGSTPHWWFGAPMGRMGTYRGFHRAPGLPFSGFQSSFPPVGGIGRVARYINPGFFHYGMPMNAMGGMMMPRGGVEGHNMGIWSDPSMGGSGAEEEHGGGRAGEPSLGKEAASDHLYGGEASHNRRWGLQNTGASDRRNDRDMPRDKDVRHDHVLTERRHRDDRDVARERDRERDRERERHDRGGGLQNTGASERRNDRNMPRDKDVGHDLTERRHHDDRDVARERGRPRDRDGDRDRDRDREHNRDRERDRYREARDRYAYHNRHMDREPRSRSRHEYYGMRRRPASK